MLSTAGGSEYTFLFLLAVVCLFFWVYLVPFLGPIKPALHRPLFPEKRSFRGVKKNKFLAVSFLELLKCAIMSWGFVKGSDMLRF